MIVRRTILLLLVLILGACVPKRQPAPQPRPEPLAQVAPRPLPQPVPPPARADWRDMPLSPGGWTYGAGGDGSQAAFGPAGAQAAFVVRCDRVRRQVSLGRAGATAGAVTVRSSTDARSLPTAVQAGYAFAALPASDRLLDSLAFSRGRFTIETAGTGMLVVPSWPELARVVEDCRG